jgi:divalent metal cation (Fe/Co/Zn/Cd) transporter
VNGQKWAAAVSARRIPEVADTCAESCTGEPLAVTPERHGYLTRARRLEGFTVGWNVLEGVVAIGAGGVASSIALIGFGVDSFIEVLSGLVMIWRLRAESAGHLPNEEAERRAIKLIAVTFFILAAYVSFESVRDLLTGEKAETSMVGLILTAVSLVVMPVLAYKKRRLAREMGSASLQADSTETQLCVYLSGTVFLGLAANALFGWWWMDSVAALVVAAIALREGYAAWTKEDLCCD